MEKKYICILLCIIVLFTGCGFENTKGRIKRVDGEMI